MVAAVLLALEAAANAGGSRDATFCFCQQVAAQELSCLSATFPFGYGYEVTFVVASREQETIQRLSAAPHEGVNIGGSMLAVFRLNTAMAGAELGSNVPA